MFAFIISRVLQAIPVLLIVGFIAFAMFKFVGDPVTIMLGTEYTEASKAALIKQLGLDQPFFVQYAKFMMNAAQGHFGVSYRLARPVLDLLAERLPATLELAGTAAVLSLLIGVPMGVYTGIKRNAVSARLFMIFSLIGVSLPTFLIGILLIYCFSVLLHWLPSYGRGDVVNLGYWTTGFLTISGLKSLVLPAITLGLFQMTLIMRLVRAEMLEVLRSDYVKLARARGLSVRAINFGHALKNTLVPVITIAGLQLGGIIAFSIVTETVFQWPGMGLLFVTSLGTRDYPVLMAILMVGALIVVLGNLAADVLTAVIDPRIKAAHV